MDKSSISIAQISGGLFTLQYEENRFRAAKGVALRRHGVANFIDDIALEKREI